MNNNTTLVMKQCLSFKSAPLLLLALFFKWSSAFTNIPVATTTRSTSSSSSSSGISTITTSVIRTTKSTKLFYANDDDDADDNNNDGITEQTAYENRSLAWTNRYRKLFPYESARRHAISLGIGSKEEWIARAGKPYMIRRPDKMYQEEWVSWDEFLGVMRPYEETKYLVRYVLQIKDMEEYRNFVRGDNQRAAGLRIPVKPEIYYKNSGWEGPDNFFGSYS